MKWYFWTLIIVGIVLIVYFVWKYKTKNWEKCAKLWETAPNPGGPGYVSGDFSLEASCGKKPIGSSNEGLMCNWVSNDGSEVGIGIIVNGKCKLRNI